MNKTIQTIIKGAAMGMAEVIPGVSGGTIAFITGIYERLLNAIKGIGPALFTSFKKDGFKGMIQAVDGIFLAKLLGGMVLGVLIGVFSISYLLENYPPLVWGFFFGLIIGSAIYIFRKITDWSWTKIVAFILGTAFAYGITTIAPSNGSESLIVVFLAGVIAISALILPGISGSFMLLLMGMYSFIITDTLKGFLKTFAFDKLVTLIVFALGCLTGLMTISRLLSWTFKNYKNVTLAALAGFMVGSLNKIWPWRIPTKWLEDAAGNVIMKDGLPKKIIMEKNVLPTEYEQLSSLPSFMLGTIVLIVIGYGVVILMSKMEKSEVAE